MSSANALFEAAVEVFREELAAAIQAVSSARNPREFTDAEREIVRLSRKFADDMVQRSLQALSDDPERVREAMSLVREKAATRGITMRTMGRLLGRPANSEAPKAPVSTRSSTSSASWGAVPQHCACW